MPSKTPKQPPLSWIKPHKWLSLLILLLLIIIGFSIYQKISIYNNKRAFEQARTTIDSIYADIVKQVGQPDNHKRVSSCDYASREFGHGPLGCSVYVEFAYSVNNNERATSIVKRSSVILSSDQKITYSNLSSVTPFKNISKNPLQRVSISFSKNSYGFTCTLTSVYSVPYRLSGYLSVANKGDVLSSIIGCEGPAKQAYYKLQ